MQRCNGNTKRMVVVNRKMLEIWLESQDLLRVSPEPAVKVEAVAKLDRKRTPGMTVTSSAKQGQVTGICRDGKPCK